MDYEFHTPAALPNLRPGEFSEDTFDIEAWTPPTFDEMAAFMDAEMQRPDVGPFASGVASADTKAFNYEASFPADSRAKLAQSFAAMNAKGSAA